MLRSSGGARSQDARIDRLFDDLAVAHLDPIGVRSFVARDDLAQLAVDELQPDARVRGIAGAHPVLEQLAVARSPELLVVVVRAEAPRQESEAIHLVELRAERVGHALGEPADAAGARARQHDAALPRLSQELVDAVD